MRRVFTLSFVRFFFPPKLQARFVVFSRVVRWLIYNQPGTRTGTKGSRGSVRSQRNMSTLITKYDSHCRRGSLKYAWKHKHLILSGPTVDTPVHAPARTALWDIIQSKSQPRRAGLSFLLLHARKPGTRRRCWILEPLHHTTLSAVDHLFRVS